MGIVRNKRATALPRHDKAFGAQRRDCLAHDRPRNAHGRHEPEFRWQTCSRTEAAAANFAGNTFRDFVNEVAGRAQRLQ